MKIKKVSFYFLLFVSIIVLNFLLPRFMPGGPVAYLEGGGDNSMMLIMTQEQKALLLEYYGLDQSLYEQFFNFINGLLHGDLGTSVYFKSPVTDVILSHAKWTVFLVGSSIVLTVSIGMILGVVSAWMQGKRKDYLMFTFLLAVGAVPGFVIGILLLLFFSIQWQLFPLGGSVTAFAEYGEGLTGAYYFFIDLMKHAVLPVLTLTLANIPSVYLLIRNSTLTVLNEPYLFTAEAKGLSRVQILFRHALRNALLPIFTLVALRIAFLFTGAILVETVFSYPGMGKLFYSAIISRDYPLMNGVFLIFTAAILTMNLVIELLNPVLDPRIRRKDIRDYA
jgi:peptide/nickel transport system permease protein